MKTLVNHYRVNDRLLEIIMEECVYHYPDINTNNVRTIAEQINIQSLMNRIGTEFKELYYDDKDKLIKGAIDGKYQILEISDQLLRKSIPLIQIMRKWLPDENSCFILKNVKTAAEHKMPLLEILKILRNYQPNILHRFKGLGENDPDDIKTTIMDPNTRSLLKINISDIQNDTEIFNILRSNSPQYAAIRKSLMYSFTPDKSLIDT